MRAITVILVLLLAFAVVAVADEAVTREKALGQLADKNNAEARRLGVIGLGDMGKMEDIPLLVQALRDPDEVVRLLAGRSLWEVWSRSGDPDVDVLFQRGLAQMNGHDLDGAIETFSQIIQKKPDFAEGWNKRATLYYLAGEFQKSLADCEEVIRRNPVHFGALSGFGLIYLRIGKPEQALDYFERALAVNPNLAGIRATIEELKQFLEERRRNSA